MLTRYEKTALYIIVVVDLIKRGLLKIKRGFIKTFPVVGIILASLFGIGLVGRYQNEHLTAEHIPYIYGTVIAFTALAILWFALTYKDKLRAKRGYYERKERR
jgi:hypothetical protein